MLFFFHPVLQSCILFPSFFQLLLCPTLLKCKPAGRNCCEFLFIPKSFVVCIKCCTNNKEWCHCRSEDGCRSVTPAVRQGVWAMGTGHASFCSCIFIRLYLGDRIVTLVCGEPIYQLHPLAEKLFPPPLPSSNSCNAIWTLTLYAIWTLTLDKTTNQSKTCPRWN